MLQLREAIFAGRWCAGDRLPIEEELAVELKAGRSSIREAIKGLEHAGVVTIRPGRRGGTYVAEPSYRQIGNVLGTLFQMRGFGVEELFQARRHIEPAVAACAAEFATSTDLMDLRFILDQIESRLRQGEDVSALNAQFHFVIARSTHNSLLAMLTASLLDLVRQISVSGLKVRDQRLHALGQHRDLIGAIAAHQPARAREIMGGHLHDMGEEVAHSALAVQ
jgi:GntR family transcriptional regulator, transcriptional repressor for pyruvate dehydrogenase complex